MNSWYKLLLVMLAGGVGSLSRYAMTGFAQSFAGLGVPFGTLVVNVLGCLGAGFLWSGLERWQALNSDLRIILLVGFFGAFTTFSSYALETVVLLRAGQWLGAITNVLMQNILGLFALILGIMLGKALL